MALQTDTSATAQVLEEQILALQQEIQALQKKQTIFDRVKLPWVKPFSRLAPANTTATPERVNGVPMQRASGNPAPMLPTTAPTPLPPIHPFANSNPRPNPRYQGPMPDQRNDQGAYQNKALIADQYQSKDIFDKCLGTPITLTMGKLCGVSVEIRNHFWESTSPKWLVNINEVTTLDSMPAGEDHSAFISTNELSKIHKMYHQGLSQETVPDGLYVAKELDSIRTIKATLNNTSEVDCIIDSGSQVVAISEAMVVKLGLSWDPCITLKMVSANRQTDATLGLAKNVPVAIRSMTFVLQFHVIRNPSYEVLLG
ncbi:hypothetical protein C0991_009637 [Blastosporella zonata]|nr:hypothetical protein C0991_009637 [Blastosporella zonata]